MQRLVLIPALQEADILQNYIDPECIIAQLDNKQLPQPSTKIQQFIDDIKPEDIAAALFQACEGIGIGGELLLNGLQLVMLKY